MINVDASFDSDTGSGSTGVVIRDATAECVGASCCHLPHVTDAAMAEAYALRDGLQLDQQIGVIVHCSGRLYDGGRRFCGCFNRTLP